MSGINGWSRRIFTSAVAVVCLGGLSVGCGGSSFDKNKLSESHAAMALVASLSYGNTNETIGILEDMQYGPHSFSANSSGDVYILDTVQNAVKRFSANGELIESIPIDCKGHDLVVDDDGAIFVLDRKTQTLHAFRQNGEKAWVTILNEKGSIIPLHIRIQKDELLLVNIDQEEAVVARRVNGVMMPTTELQFQKGQMLRNGTRAETLRTADRRGVLILNNKRIELPIPNVASVSFLGEDESGLLYLQVESFRKSGVGVDLHVVCLNTSMELVSAIWDIPNQYAVWTDRLLYLTPKGDLYQVIPEAEGVRVHLWTKKPIADKGGQS